VLYPLLVLLVVDGLARLLALRPKALALAASALLALQASNAIAIAPHYLSYFSPLAGGPEEGYRQLVDSNLDWGQDLPALSRKLRELHSRRPLLAYFGTTPPESHGLQAVAWREGAGPDECDYLAVSATYLQGVGLEQDPFAQLRALPPTTRAGYSFFIYDLRRADVREALAPASIAERRRPHATCHSGGTEFVADVPSLGPGNSLRFRPGHTGVTAEVRHSLGP
jgi:hypothetical protein